MKAVARLGDSTSHGGVIVSGDSKVNVNGKPMARVGDKVSCPKCGDNKIVEGMPDIHGSNSKLIAVIGSKTACGAVIPPKSSSLLKRGGLPCSQARMVA